MEEIRVEYPKVDDLVQIIKSLGRGCLLYKRDLKRAYRQIPVDPGDIHLLGFSWNWHLFVDRVLTMGLRRAAFICQRVTSALAYIFEERTGLSIINYLDDFAGGAKPTQALAAYTALAQVFLDAGFEESQPKALAPSTHMPFVGVLFNSVSLTLEITPDRLSEILDIVHVWLRKPVARRKEVQSLLGKLNFIASCVKPGRIFICRLLGFLKEHAT